MKMTRSSEDQRLILVEGMTSEQWKLLRDEIIDQDQEDSCILELETEVLITTTETEDPEDNLWAQYNPITQTATFFQVTLDEYLLDWFVEDVRNPEEIEPIIEEMKAAYQELK